MKVFKKFNNNIYPACTFNIKLKQAFFIRITPSWLYKSICSHVSIDQGEIIIKHFRHFHPLHARLWIWLAFMHFLAEGQQRVALQIHKAAVRGHQTSANFLEKPLKPKLEKKDFLTAAGTPASHLWLCAAVVPICHSRVRDVSFLLSYADSVIL